MQKWWNCASGATGAQVQPLEIQVPKGATFLKEHRCKKNKVQGQKQKEQTCRCKTIGVGAKILRFKVPKMIDFTVLIAQCM